MESIYKDIELNDEQKQAIEYIGGPLLVIAGPGTGKTQLLSSRVAYILENTDTAGRNILCLTFTNKATLNMKERLLDITEGKARDVNIKTFHSFASEIMNMYPDYFWNGAKLSVAPDAVAREIIQNILTELPLDNPLAMKFYGKFTGISDVTKGIQLANEAGLTPDKLEAIVKLNIAYIDSIETSLVDILSETLSYKKLSQLKEKIFALTDHKVDAKMTPLISLSTYMKESLESAINNDEETNKASNTSDWKKKWVQTVAGKKGMFEERKRNNWWLQLSDVYRKYRNELHRRGYYDYSDMVLEVITQLETQPELLADVQERFLYVMIDEFQDTNYAQLRLAHLVANHFSAEDNPEIMAVGDDDQSIFKFNGAELSNMLTFRRSYPKCKTIVLKENYRSTQNILNTSAKIIDQADERLVNYDRSLNKDLTAKADIKPGVIEHRIYKTAEEQIYDISKTIASEYSDKKTFAVIARGHKSLMQIAEQLLKIGIPLNYEQQRNILDHPMIEEVYNLAQICESIKKGDKSDLNFYLSQTLTHPMWQIPARTLWKLALDNYKNPNWLESLTTNANKNILEISDFLLNLSKEISGQNLSVSFEYIIGLREVSEQRSPIYKYYVESKNIDVNEYLYGLSAIKTLRGLVNEYSAENSATLNDFVNFVILEKNNGTIINDESPFVTGEHAVNLLSVHKAKGLEFDNVYIIDAVENNWKPKSNRRKPPMNLPLQPVFDDMDDYIRLMFVAVTRAKQNLVISSYTFDESGKESIATPIISGIIESIEAKSDDKPTDILETALTWPRLQTSEEKEMLKARLQTYSLSVTNLFNFLDVTAGGPEKFLQKNLMRLPEVKSANLAFGTAIHACLETAQKLVNKGDFSLTKVIDKFNEALDTEHLIDNDKNRYQEHGKKLLTKVFSENLLTLNKGSLPEQDLKDIFINKARLNGKLDRIEQTDNQIIVTDYKTGTPLGSFITNSKDDYTQIKAWKQRTQLIYYALLLKNSGRFEVGKKEIIGQMIYLEAEASKDFIKQYTPSQQEIDRLGKLVQAVWKKIIVMDLPDTKKYPNTYAGILEFENDLLK